MIGNGCDRPEGIVDLADLRAASLHDLRVLWRRIFRRHPPPGLTRSLLIGMLAYERQAEMLGDLPPRHHSFLDRVISRMGRETEGRRKPLVPPLPTNSMQPGTVLVREWNGKTEAVTVVQGGFLWAGVTYPTLSAVANAITGRHWNGWVFFGLKRPGSRSRGEGTPSQEMATQVKASSASVASLGVAAGLVATPQPPRRRGRPPKVRPVIALGATP